MKHTEQSATEQHAPQAKHSLGFEPCIDPTARVERSELGIYTAIGPRTNINESKLDDYSYVMNDSSIMHADIGRFCSIAAQTRLNPGNHPLWRPALHHFTYRSRSYGFELEDDHGFFAWRRKHQVTVGHDVWIGHGVTVLPNVTIGTGAAIGAGAVVSKDVPAFAVVAGVPAKIIRYRFDEATQERLLRLAWWNWDRRQLEAALPDFRDLGMEDFLTKYEEL